MERVEGEREYLIFYRWVHWVILILAGLFYSVRKLSKLFENVKIKKLFEVVAQHISKYDFSGDAVELAGLYLTFNARTNDALFFKYLACNIYALLTDICTFFILDFCLNNRFLNLGYDTYPFTKDIVQFSDPLSQAFSPLVDCELTPGVAITYERAEKFGCHLTMMEYYKKYFVALWCYLIISTTLTACYILYLILFLFPFTRRLVLNPEPFITAKECDIERANEGLDSMKVGDIFLLYRLEYLIPHINYYKLLKNITDVSYKEYGLIKSKMFHKLKNARLGNSSLKEEKPPIKESNNIIKRRNKVFLTQ